ncbi:MAG: Asp-tRNA(Asn)/Glu-tRNA(Gln) amidotransferase subunit GatB [Candidatus Lokiarchaeota archaeon]|nr:Asp-tRNA(Asn)/Glu-tRNA(Gln) amidotransferase subunit GatB [Candidatus Lokiarchaeota archaeon]
MMKSKVDSKFTPMIGLEIHCQLNTLKTKLFCSCNAQFRGEEPNTYTCPVCLGLPGSLPTVNENAIDCAIKLAHAFDSKINKRMYFFRKNYFYPDLPQNFQITQYNKAGGVAFADGGTISIKFDNKIKNIELDRFHLENDPGKLVHEGGDIESSNETLVDYNRSGIALIEIVTKPVIESPREARIFLKKLRSIISHCEIVDLTKDGAMRVDANISIKGHARAEVKNINSFKEVERALKWEIKRQINKLKKGQETEQETRNWNGKITTLLRSKESENEYRYFPEADLVPIEIKQDWIDDIKEKMPELPDERIARLQEEYGLKEYDATVITEDKEVADFYEECCKLNENYEAIKNWLMNDIMGILNEENLSISSTELKPKLVDEFISAIDSGKVTTKIAKKYISKIIKGIGIKKWMKKQGVKKITDKEKLNELADKIISDNPDVVEDLKKKPKTFQYFVGQMMKATRGQADIQLTRKILKEKLKKYMK